MATIWAPPGSAAPEPPDSCLCPRGVHLSGSMVLLLTRRCDSSALVSGHGGGRMGAGGTPNFGFRPDFGFRPFRPLDGSGGAGRRPRRRASSRCAFWYQNCSRFAHPHQAILQQSAVAQHDSICEFSDRNARWGRGSNFSPEGQNIVQQS